MNLVLDAVHTHACILALAADPCLCPGEHLRDRLSVNHSEVKTMPADSFGTWQAVGAEWITIGKYDGSTLVFVVSQDSFYHASPSVMLSSACPDQTVFIAQFVMDTDNTPRVLVHDLSRLRGVSLVDIPPQERYAHLQGMGGMLGPVCTVQWAGDCRALGDELRSGRFKVPHAVRAVLGLTNVPGRMLSSRLA